MAPPQVTKKRAKEIASEKLRLECVAQFGLRTTENTTTPVGDEADQPPITTETIADTTPPLDEDDIDDVQVEDQDIVPDGVSVRHGTQVSAGPPSKRRRGFCNMEKVRQIVKATGKIKFKYDAFIKGPSSSTVNSLLSGSIGSIIRTKVKLSAENWEDLHDNEKKKLTRGLSPYFIIDYDDKRVWEWVQEKAGSIYRDWKGDFSRFYKEYGREVVPRDLVQRKDEWDWLCRHFESPQFKVRSAANTINRTKNESEHHAGRLPIIYRVVQHKEKGEEFPVIPTYKETHDIANDPKAAKNLEDMHRVASELKDAQKNANPEVPESELPPLGWSDNITVLETVVGRRTSKDVRCLGRVGAQGSSSSTRPSQIDDDLLNIVMEKAKVAEENSKKSEEATQEVKEQLALVKEQLAAVMAIIAQQGGSAAPIPSQQPPNCLLTS